MKWAFGYHGVISEIPLFILAVPNLVEKIYERQCVAGSFSGALPFRIRIYSHPEIVAPPERNVRGEYTFTISKQINQGVIAKKAMNNSAYIGKYLARDNSEGSARARP